MTWNNSCNVIGNIRGRYCTFTGRMPSPPRTPRNVGDTNKACHVDLTPNTLRVVAWAPVHEYTNSTGVYPPLPHHRTLALCSSNKLQRLMVSYPRMIEKEKIVD